MGALVVPFKGAVPQGLCFGSGVSFVAGFCIGRLDTMSLHMSDPLCDTEFSVGLRTGDWGGGIKGECRVGADLYDGPVGMEAPG